MADFPQREKTIEKSAGAEEEGEQIKVFTDITVGGGKASNKEAAFTVSATILNSIFLFVKHEVGEGHLVPVLVTFATYILFVCTERSSLLFG